MAQKRNGTPQYFFVNDPATLAALKQVMAQHGANKSQAWRDAMRFYAASLTELTPAARARIWKKVQETKS